MLQAGSNAKKGELIGSTRMVHLCGGEPQQCASPSGPAALLPVEIVLVCSRGAHLLRLDHLAHHDAIVRRG